MSFYALDWIPFWIIKLSPPSLSVSSIYLLSHLKFITTPASAVDTIWCPSHFHLNTLVLSSIFYILIVHYTSFQDFQESTKVSKILYLFQHTNPQLLINSSPKLSWTTSVSHNLLDISLELFSILAPRWWNELPLLVRTTESF